MAIAGASDRKNQLAKRTINRQKSILSIAEISSVLYVSLIISGSINQLCDGPLTVTVALIDGWIATLDAASDPLPSLPRRSVPRLHHAEFGFHLQFSPAEAPDIRRNASAEVNNCFIIYSQLSESDQVIQ